MDRLLKWLEIPIHLLMWLGLLAGALMMAHVTADVTGRTVFNRPFEGTTEIVSGIYMVTMAYLPWAWIARNNGHIKVDLFASFAPPRVVEWLEILVKIVTLVYVALFAWRSGVRAVQQTALGEVWLAGTGYLPVWPSRWVLPVAGFMMALYLFVRVAADLAALTRRSETPK